MSRVILSKHPDGSHRFVVGWDYPARGAFWQEWASKEEIKKAEDDYREAEKAGKEPYDTTEQIVETGVKRNGGMWPGIPIHKLHSSVPQEYRELITDEVLTLLEQHKADPDSGYMNALTDWSGKEMSDFTIRLSRDERVAIAKMCLKHAESIQVALGATYTGRWANISNEFDPATDK